MKLFGHSAVEDILCKKFNEDVKDSMCAEGDATTVEPFTSIKLFGKTVQVKDCCKPSIAAENFKSATSKTGLEDINAANEKLVQALPLTYLDTHLSLGTVTDNWSAMPSRANLSPCMEIHPDKNDHSSSDASLPWLAFYHGLPFYYITSFNQTRTDSCSEERMKEKEVPNERSYTGSNTGSVSQAENREKNSDSVDSEFQLPCPAKTSSQKFSKGFVPYKRCLAERDMSSSVVASEEQERQRARVCS